MGNVTIPQSSSRSKRGLAVYRTCGGEIIPKGNGKIDVPGQGQDFYEVDLEAETCNCPDFTNRHQEAEEAGEAFYCKHMFAAMLYSIKHPEAVAAADARANTTAADQSERQPSRCAGCGVPSGKPSEGGSILSGKGPGQSLYCMDCNPAFMPRAQASVAIEAMAQKAGVA